MLKMENIYSGYLLGIFKNEIKNRFLCLVNVGGKDIICYIPSSCRLSNFIDLTNRSVLLKPVAAKNAKTKYSVYAIEYKKHYILVNMTESNRIIETQIGRRFFSFLGERKKIMREAIVNGYKSDLFIKDTNTIIEIKSILSFDKQTKFPTVYSERAIKQLTNLRDILKMGYKICYMFISLNPSIKNIYINREMQDFYYLFVDCVKKGMMYCGFSVRLKNAKPVINRTLSVNITDT